MILNYEVMCFGVNTDETTILDSCPFAARTPSNFNNKIKF